jgi:hypothetical protein
VPDAEFGGVCVGNYRDIGSILIEDEACPIIPHLETEKRELVNEDGLCDPTTWGVVNMNWLLMREISTELFMARVGCFQRYSRHGADLLQGFGKIEMPEALEDWLETLEMVFEIGQTEIIMNRRKAERRPREITHKL